MASIQASIYLLILNWFFLHLCLCSSGAQTQKLHVIGCFTSPYPWALWLSGASLGGSISAWSNDGGQHAKVRGKVSFSVGVPSKHKPCSIVDLAPKSSQFESMELSPAVLRLCWDFETGRHVKRSRLQANLQGIAKGCWQVGSELPSLGLELSS